MNDYLQELKELPLNKYGAIEASKVPHAKFYGLRSWIYSQTSFLPSEFKLADRVHCILTGESWPKFCKCGCGLHVSSPRKNYVHNHGNDAAEVKEKKRQAFLKKYGVENPSQAAQVKESKIRTCEDRYGTSHYMKSEKGKSEHKLRMLELHGVENSFQLQSSKSKIRQKWLLKRDELLKKRSATRFKRFYDSLSLGRLGDCSPLFSLEEYCGVDHKYPFQCKKCDASFVSSMADGSIPRCPQCGPKFQSEGELEILKFVSELGLAASHRERSACWPIEIDVFIPSKKLGIEFDGLYWHSAEKLSERGVDPKKYHAEKTVKCEEKGIRLVHIFEDEWVENGKIVKARLRGLLGQRKFKLDARHCEVKEIKQSVKNKFLDKYHLQGKDASSVSLGLFYKTRLTAVMTFGKLRSALGQVPEDGNWELCRFAPLSNFSIRGGAGKLLKYFEENWKPKKIVTYADLRWSRGELYEALGFKKDHNSPPGYWYVTRANKRIHRWNLRKSELKKLLGENYDEAKTEQQMAKEAGYKIVYDCGQAVYIKI